MMRKAHLGNGPEAGKNCNKKYSSISVDGKRYKYNADTDKLEDLDAR